MVAIFSLPLIIFCYLIQLSYSSAFTENKNPFFYDYPFDHGNPLQPNVIRPLSLSYYPWPFHFHFIKLDSNKDVKNNSMEIVGRSSNRNGPLTEQLDNDLRHDNPGHLDNNAVVSVYNSEEIGERNDVDLEDKPFLNMLLSRPANLWLWSGVSMAGVGAGLAGLSALPILSSLNLVRTRSDFSSCTTILGESGICTSIADCRIIRGNLNGICLTGGRCCINSVRRCGSTVKYNNTYWTSPSSVKSGSPCSVAVTLDPEILEQLGPICQLRLDFERFVIAQPNSEGVCNEDVFHVAGTDGVPSICGNNAGQHMYLNVPAPLSTILISFSFGNSATNREWKIKIAMFSCLAGSLLAPNGCLQYFTAPVGSFRSFNWEDTNLPSTRQLAFQDYHVCFRTELVDNIAATTICMTPSVALIGGKPFSLTGSGAMDNTAGQGGLSQASPEDCNNDFLIIKDGYDPLLPRGPANICDRFCGERLNCAPSNDASATVCTTNKPFRIYYHTNADETITNAIDAAGLGNLGFSMRFDQRIA